MSKQDRTHSRTPADTENKFLRNLGKTFAEIMGIATDARTTAEGTRSELSKAVAAINKEIADKGASISLIVSDGKVKGEILIEAINDESSAKIKADNILFEGQRLNVKVDATNIEGELTADQINADGINVQMGEIGDWVLGESDIPTSATNTIKEKALYSGIKEHRISDLVWYTVETWLTAKGVYSVYKYYTNEGGLNFTNYYSSMWWELLKKTNISEKWKFTLEDGTPVIKEMFVN